MKRDLKSFAYGITGNPDEADYKYHYSDDIKELLLRTYRKVHKKKIKNPQELLKLIERYPNVPAFKNYLVVNYQLQGKPEKARSANHWLVKEHPDYLFGKLNLCAEYLEDDKLDKIPKVLGEALDLKDLYPEREMFFVQEFSSFLNISCRYLIADKALEAAESRIEAATQILGNGNDIIQQLNGLLNEAISKKNREKYKEALAKRELVEEEFPRKDYSDIQTTTPPKFNHDEIWELYNHDLKIEKSILEKILALPRITLLEDLEKVLLDSIQRFDFFQKKLSEEESWGKHGSFPIHALALLAQLEAKEKLPFIFKHLSETEGMLDLWFEDHLYETVWHFIYQLSQDDLPELLKYQKDRNISPAVKIIIQQAVAQVPRHQPERQQEVLQWFKEILEFCLENIAEPLLSDYEIVSNVVCELYNLPSKELLQLVKQCYDLDLVDQMFCGDFDYAKKSILNESKKGRELEVYEHISDLYNDIVTTWHGYTNPKTEDELQVEILEKEKEKKLKKLKELNAKLVSQKKLLEEKIEIVFPDIDEATKKVMPKVGRNEPCPCGSGKKYKKCCINK